LSFSPGPEVFPGLKSRGNKRLIHTQKNPKFYMSKISKVIPKDKFPSFWKENLTYFTNKVLISPFYKNFQKSKDQKCHKVGKRHDQE